MAARGFAQAGIARREASETGVDIVGTPDFASIFADWAALAARPECGNLFFHPEFAIPAMQQIGGSEIVVALVRSASGAPVALAPMTRARLGWLAPAVRLWTHKYAPLGEPLVSAEDTEAAVARLVEGLAPEGSGLSLVLPEMDTDSAVAEAIRIVSARSGRPLVLLDEHRRAMLTREAAGDLRARLSSGRRKELGRQLRRLGDQGPVTFTSDTLPDRVGACFEEFLALEQAGWKGREGTALASSADTAEFSRTALSELARAGKARIDSLRVGERPVAILVNLVAGRVAYSWKIAYDESYAQYSPGAQLMLETPAHLFADPAVMLIDSCATADHPMIDKLWPERRGIATFILGPPGGSTLFSIGLAAAKAELAARANVRHLRDRFG